jgi:hypothetical protein
MKTKIILLFLALLSIPAAHAQVCGAAPHCVVLSWTASVDPSVTGYNIYRQIITTGTCPASVTSTTGYTKINTASVVGLTYTDSAVSNPSTECYVATAVNGSGRESGPSNVASATLNFPPSPPTMLGAVAN